MQFQSIIGQSETAERLTQLVKQNRLSHAILFLTKEGAGGLSLARAFAQYIVCEKVNAKTGVKPSAAPEPSLFGGIEQLADTDPESSIQHRASYPDSCGECPACKKATALIHPDIHFSYPVIVKKAGEQPISTDYIKEWREFLQTQPYGNAFDWLQHIGAENRQGNITSKECEDILRKMSLKSFESEYKILIIWMPELLGKEGNKLLKLIEEPPKDTVFILVAENEALILPTVLSRTQLIKIPVIEKRDVQAALEMREGMAQDKASKLAAISGGNYREALQLLQHADDDWEVMLRDWLNSIAKTGPAAQVKWIEEMSKTGREKQKQFLKYFTHLLHHSTRIRTTGIEYAGQTESEPVNEFAVRLNKLCTLNQQEAIVKELDNASYYIERNANAKITFHALTIKLYYIISNKSVISLN